MGRILLLCSLLPAVARAAPTGLNQIPTTDLVPFKQVTLQLTNGNTAVRGSQSVFHEPAPEPQSEFGLPWDMETGLDVAPSDPPHAYRPEFNIKWRAVREDYYIPAVATGVDQIGPGFTPNYYLVLSKTLNYEQIQYQKFRAHHRNIKLRGIRLHAGVQYTSYDWQALVGSDIEVNDYFVIYSDWISGAQNFWSLGGVFVFNQHFSAQGCVLRENDRDGIRGAIAVITYTFDVEHPLDW